jgi:hypothetical protein
MANEDMPARRSTPREYLLRILDGQDPADKGLERWAGGELEKVAKGFYDKPDELYLAVPKEVEGRFGLPRPPTNILTENYQTFADRIIDAYLDARTYPEYQGIKIRIDIKSPLGSASGSTTYAVSASFKETVGPDQNEVYETKLTFNYLHQHADGSFNKDVFIKDQLESLASLLGKRISSSDEMIFDSETLIIRSKQT